MNLPRAFAVIALALLATTTAIATPDVHYTETLGDAAVEVPVLDGFTPPATTPKVLRDLFEHSLPAQYRLSGISLQQAFVDSARAGDTTAKMSRYAIAAVNRSFEDQSISPELFDAFKAQFRQAGNAALREAEARAATGLDRMSKEVGKITGDVATSIKVGQTRSLGVFDERPNSIAMATVHTVTIENGQNKGSTPQVMAMAIARVRGKPLLFYVYSNYESDADIDWAEDQVRAWLTRLDELNP